MATHRINTPAKTNIGIGISAARERGFVFPSTVETASVATGVLTAGSAAVAGAADGAWSVWGTSIGNAFEQHNPALALVTTTTNPGFTYAPDGSFIPAGDITHTTSNLTPENLYPVGAELTGLALIAAPFIARFLRSRRTGK